MDEVDGHLPFKVARHSDHRSVHSRFGTRVDVRAAHRPCRGADLTRDRHHFRVVRLAQIAEEGLDDAKWPYNHHREGFYPFCRVHSIDALIVAATDASIVD